MSATGRARYTKRRTAPRGSVEATMDTAGKTGLLAGWDLGDTIRVVMVVGMVYLTIEAPATTTLPQPYAGIALAAYYWALATALFAPQFWARFGRVRVVGPEAVVLPGDRLFQFVTCLALVAATPMTVVWAIETPSSDWLSFGFYWFCIVLFIGAAALCLRNLLRSNDLIRIDAEGIAAPRLWHGTIPWGAVKGAAVVGTRSNNQLRLLFETPTDVVLAKRPFLDFAVTLGTEKRSLTIPGILLGMPAEKIAAILEERIRTRAR
jgi:hypothetical protein